MHSPYDHPPRLTELLDLRIDPATKRALEALASGSRMSVSAYVRGALRRHVIRAERDASLAWRRARRPARSGGGPA